MMGHAPLRGTRDDRHFGGPETPSDAGDLPEQRNDVESIRRADSEYKRLGYVDLAPDKVMDTSVIRYAQKVLGSDPHSYSY